jgi:hypothetical protein
MKFLPLFALAALVALTGCQTTYRRLTVTNFDGEPVSTFVSEGRIYKREHGYDIRAVERYVDGPHPVSRRFPNAWRTTVVGANVVVEEIDKPDWLVAMDAGEAVALEVFESPTGWPKIGTTLIETKSETK